MNFSSSRALAGLSFLVVEDEILIAFDAKAMLEEAGAGLVQLAPKADDAIQMISAKPPHAAVLDVNLGSGTSFPVADALALRGIPYVFTTGYGGQIDLPALHLDMPVVGKPYSSEMLIAGLISALERSQFLDEQEM